MRRAFNQQTLLWIIGVIQPAAPNEIRNYLLAAFNKDESLPTIDEIQKFCFEQERLGRLLRIRRSPNLFSLTLGGNAYFDREYRYARDRERIYLLKTAHRARIGKSREELVKESGGVSPSVDARTLTKRGEANKSGLVVPRVQIYWPRLSKQFSSKTGPLQTSRDTDFNQYLSFSNAKQLNLASNSHSETLEISANTMGLMIGISPGLIVSFLRKPEKHWRSFSLKKKCGGERIIESPRLYLKIAQQFCNDYLFHVLPVHESVTSYRPRCGIKENAAQHVGKRFVANIDIENYFGSITHNQVHSLFVACGFDTMSSSLLTAISTKDGHLPQGAPTSPSISNAVLFDFDAEMAAYCFRMGLKYTRYADDITISGESHKTIIAALTFAKIRLSKNGFKVKDEKTRIASRYAQQRVTGLVTNSGVRPPRVFRRRVRAAFHNASLMPEASIAELPKLRGYLNYLSGFDELAASSELKSYSNVIKKIMSLAK